MFHGMADNNSKLDQLMEEHHDDSNYIFDNFVEGFFNSNELFMSSEALSVYFMSLSKYVRHFHQQQVNKFQMYLEDRFKNFGTDLMKSEILKFVINHRDIFSIEVIVQEAKPHKKLSLIDNCVLWGWEDILIMILDAGDIEMDLKLKRSDSLILERSSLLNSIKARHLNEQLMEVAMVRRDMSLYRSILSHAIITKDAMNIDVFSSWITSEELFVSFMSDVEMDGKVIEFVEKRFPQYKMIFFKINKNRFIFNTCRGSEILEILGNDEKINESQFMELMKLQDDHGWTILCSVCDWKINLNLLLQLLKRKCSNSDDITQLFKIKDKKGRTLLDRLVDERPYFRDRVYTRKKLLEFFIEMNFVELKYKLIK